MSGPVTDYQYMAMNLGDPVLRDVRVRQALTHAIVFSHPRVDALHHEASTTFDSDRRFWLYAEVQTIIVEQVPYISLWTKTNYAIASRTATGVRLCFFADSFFFKVVARLTPAPP